MKNNILLFLTLFLVFFAHIAKADDTPTSNEASVTITGGGDPVPTAADLNLLRTILAGIQLPLDVAKERSEDLYTYYNGSFLRDKGHNPTSFNLLNNPADVSPDRVNPYLQELRICEKYWIKAKFYDADAFQGSGGLINLQPLPALIAGKEIYYTPIYNNKDYKITTWQCITNFKIVLSNVSGQPSLFPFSPYNEHVYLGSCLYLPDAKAGSEFSWQNMTSKNATGACG